MPAILLEWDEQFAHMYTGLWYVNDKNFSCRTGMHHLKNEQAPQTHNAVNALSHSDNANFNKHVYNGLITPSAV